MTHYDPCVMIAAVQIILALYFEVVNVSRCVLWYPIGSLAAVSGRDSGLELHRRKMKKKALLAT